MKNEKIQKLLNAVFCNGICVFRLYCVFGFLLNMSYANKYYYHSDSVKDMPLK